MTKGIDNEFCSRLVIVEKVRHLGHMGKDSVTVRDNKIKTTKYSTDQKYILEF